MKRELDNKEIVIFADLLSRTASLGEFEIKLGLNAGEIEYHKEALGLTSAVDAKQFLDAIERTRDKERNEADLKNRKQNEKLRDKPVEAPKKKKKKKRKQKAYDTKKMQESLDKTTNRVVKSDFRVDDEKQFKIDSRLGMNFLKDKYGISRKDVVAELQRLGIEVDLIPK